MLNRRTLLTHALALPALASARFAWAATPHTGAAAPVGLLGPEHRLVVVLLRGALDGLAAVPAPGDPAYASLRPAALTGEAAPLPLDGLFALHPRLTTLHGWWQAGELLVVHATAQPYRERSHFDAQQLLESGGRRPFELQSGWLGRALEAGRAGRGDGQDQGLALLPHVPLALRGSGSQPVAGNWAPSRAAQPPADDFLERTQRLYAGDGEFEALWRRAMAQRGMAMADGQIAVRQDFTSLAQQAGRFLSQPNGPRLGWLELDGWDTHTGQAQRLDRMLGTLDAGLNALRAALGAHWASTSVLVMTEFGRSAVPNGTGGTDHGTAGVALLAGGAVRGGRVLADWPGLAPGALWQGRDLRPTTDLRALQHAVLTAHWGLGDAAIAQVLPGAPAALPDLYRPLDPALDRTLDRART